MPRGAPPSWKQRKEPILDEHVQASISAGMNEDNGHYGEMVYTGIETKLRADEIKRALFRSAKHLHVSMHAEVEALPRGRFQVRFKAINKQHARAYILEKHGSDRSQWPYDPRKRGNA